MTNKMEAKLTEVFNVLNQTKNIIEKYYYSQNGRNLHSAVFEFAKLKNGLPKYEIFRTKNVNTSYFEDNFNIDLGERCSHFFYTDF